MEGLTTVLGEPLSRMTRAQMHGLLTTEVGIDTLRVVLEAAIAELSTLGHWRTIKRTNHTPSLNYQYCCRRRTIKQTSHTPSLNYQTYSHRRTIKQTNHTPSLNYQTNGASHR